MPARRQTRGPARRPVDDERRRAQQRARISRPPSELSPLAQAVREMDASIGAAVIFPRVREGRQLARWAWNTGAMAREFEEERIEGRRRRPRLIVGDDLALLLSAVTREARRLVDPREGSDLPLVSGEAIADVLYEVICAGLERLDPGQLANRQAVFTTAVRGYCAIALIGEKGHTW